MDIWQRGRRLDENLAWGISGVEICDLATPRSSFIEKEDSDEPDEPPRVTAFPLLMGYLLAEGPHPEAVTHRLYILAENIAPDLLRELSTTDRRQLVEDSPAAAAWRILTLLVSTRAQNRRADAHEVIIQKALAAAHTRLRAPERFGTIELSEILAPGSSETLPEFTRRQEAIAALLRFIFFEGPAPRRTVRRVYVLAKVMAPLLILNMTLTDLGEIFGETRAAWSWRAKHKFNEYLASRGAKACKANYQKSDAACEKYSKAQLGNRNRIGGARAA